MQTVFSKIINGELPCNKVLEDDEFLAFHDINPQAPIHILIIPKQYYKNFQDVTPEIMSKMTKFMQEVAKIMGVDKSGYRLISNCGENAGQEVMHLHFHMLGGMNLGWNRESGINTKDEF